MVGMAWDPRGWRGALLAFDERRGAARSTLISSAHVAFLPSASSTAASSSRLRSAVSVPSCVGERMVSAGSGGSSGRSSSAAAVIILFTRAVRSSIVPMDGSPVLENASVGPKGSCFSPSP
jgi:hypothetical protein